MAKGTEPAQEAASITPNDTAEITAATRGLYVGGAGNLAVVMAEGGDVTFVGVPAGTILPITVSIVKATGTTATNILALS